MKIEVNFDKLKNVVNKALCAVMKTGSNPSLKGVYFETSENSLIIRSTNIDVGFESSISCKVNLGGKFLIGGEVLGRLLSTVNSKTDTNCEMSYETGVLTFVLGKHKFTLKTLSFDSFPTLPTVSGVDVILSKNIFLEGLKSTVFCAAKSEIKPEISGVYVRFSVQDVFFVATDAYRLSERKFVLETENPDLSFIIPEKNVRELFKVFDAGTENLTLTISKNSVQIRDGSIFVVTRLIEGNFPNYIQIIPSTPVSFAIYLKDELFKSLKLTSLFSDKTQQVQFNVSESGTEVEASNNEVGNTREGVESTLKGDAFGVKLNSKYLEEFLQNTNDQSVVVKFTAQNKAIIVQGIQDSSYTYLLMPSYR